MMNKWQQILKEQAAAHGQEDVGKELGVSKTVVSQLINDKYPGDLERMQKLVEGAYMNRMVHCPILGDIPMHQCDKYQGNTSTSNPIRLRLYRACRSGCEHSVLPIKKQFKRIAMTVNTDASTPKRYSADAVYSRLERQSVTDNGGVRQLCELLKQELKAMELRYNKLIQLQATVEARKENEKFEK
ncbi:helix-turn-helix domain-containing protein [Shewanella psychrophila]|nr:helix-turn-helix transcriptional regulator [Shewanella psychrophila]